MGGKRIQCLSNALQHVPIYLDRFLVIQPVSSKVRYYSTFWPPWVRPWDNRGKCYTWIEREFNAGQTPSLQHVPIYLQPFLKYFDNIGGE